MRMLTAAFALCLATTGLQAQAANCDAEIDALENALNTADHFCDTSRPDRGRNSVCDFQMDVMIPVLNRRVFECFQREDSPPAG